MQDFAQSHRGLVLTLSLHPWPTLIQSITAFMELLLESKPLETLEQDIQQLASHVTLFWTDAWESMQQVGWDYGAPEVEIAGYNVQEVAHLCSMLLQPSRWPLTTRLPTGSSDDFSTPSKSSSWTSRPGIWGYAGISQRFLRAWALRDIYSMPSPADYDLETYSSTWTSCPRSTPIAASRCSPSMW